MSTLTVDPGACGLRAVVCVERDPVAPKSFRVSVETECRHVRALAAALPELTRMDALTAILNNPVYQAASGTLKHAACPVPAAILKALEVEAGLNVPKDATLAFRKGKAQPPA